MVKILNDQLQGSGSPSHSKQRPLPPPPRTPRRHVGPGAMPPKKKNSHVARMAQQMERRKAGNMTHGVREAALVDTSGDGRIDAREGMATTVFTVESLDLKSTNVGNYKRRGKGKGGTYKRAATTVLAGEATYDVERRVRDARRALFSDPVAFEEMRPADFDLTRGAVTLMPARPKWDYELKSGRLHSRERKAFVRWIASVKRRLIESGRGYAPPSSRTSRCGASCGASSSEPTSRSSSSTRDIPCSTYLPHSTRTSLDASVNPSSSSSTKWTPYPARRRSVGASISSPLFRGWTPSSDSRPRTEAEARGDNAPCETESASLTVPKDEREAGSTR